MGPSLKAALVLLDKKTNFSILPREGILLGICCADKGEDELSVGMPEARTGQTQLYEEISLVSRGKKGRNHHLKAPLLSRNVVRFPEEPHGVWIPRPRKIGEPSSSVTHVLQKVQPRAAREMIYILALLYTPGLPKI